MDLMNIKTIYRIYTEMTYLCCKLRPFYKDQFQNVYPHLPTTRRLARPPPPPPTPPPPPPPPPPTSIEFTRATTIATRECANRVRFRTRRRQRACTLYAISRIIANV
ncbi:hypothetical protein BLOT_010068 [Blomia tropicalis]|nr:hypothetical protein BLOT_010068 [Blomia tropicalis]